MSVQILAPPEAEARNRVRILFLLQLLSMGAMEMSGPFWPLYLQAHSPSRWAFGITTVGVYVGPMLGVTFTGAFWGRMGDRYGNKLMMVRALLGLAMTQLLVAMTTDVWAILVLRFLQGACAGYIAPAQAYGVQIEVPARRAQLFAYLQTATNVGSVGGALLGGLILDRAPFPVINITAGVVCAVCAAIVWFVLPDARTVRKVVEVDVLAARAERRSPISPPVKGLLLLLGLLLASRMVLQAPFALYVRAVFEASHAVTGACYGLLAVGFILSALHWARLFSGISVAELLRGMVLVSAACAILTFGIGLTRHIAIFMALFFIWGTFLGATTPILIAAISAATSLDRQGRMLGVSQAIQQFAALVGTALGMGFCELTGVRAIFFLVAFLYVASLAVAAILWRARTRAAVGTAAPN